MRGRYIHKIAHWSMMFLLLMFPLLMVGISTFGKESQTIDVTDTYEYETNEVNSVDDLVVGNIYKVQIDLDDYYNASNILYTNGIFKLYATEYDVINIHANEGYSFRLLYDYNLSNIRLYLTTASYVVFTPTSNLIEFYCLYYDNTNINNLTYSASDYLGEKNVDYVIHNEDYKQDVNNWINGFLNLPINSWYQSLMNVIGVGFTTSTVMNVIYVMPVYIIWVFIFDLVVDCFLVLIRLPHKLLNRLSGGENE